MYKKNQEKGKREEHILSFCISVHHHRFVSSRFVIMSLLLCQCCLHQGTHWTTTKKTKAKKMKKGEKEKLWKQILARETWELQTLRQYFTENSDKGKHNPKKNKKIIIWRSKRMKMHSYYDVQWMLRVSCIIMTSLHTHTHKHQQRPSSSPKCSKENKRQPVNDKIFVYIINVCLQNATIMDFMCLN